MITTPIRLFLIILLFFSESTLERNKLIGDWEFVGSYSKSKKFSCCPECPDVFRFETIGTYKLLNVCYGDDPKEPIAESGVWTVDKSSGKILLDRRKFTSTYYSHP